MLTLAIVTNDMGPTVSLEQFSVENGVCTTETFSDHESRNNSGHHEEWEPEEDTPLLQRFPAATPPRSPLTTVIVSLLLIILVAGVVIGIYLLVLQNDAEHILPPVEMPLQLVSRSQWDTSNTTRLNMIASPYFTKRVLAVQTGTEPCFSTKTCSALLRSMLANETDGNGVLPYNFLISSNGQTYEALGWHRSYPLFTEYSSSVLVLAFIGNFTQAPPTSEQLEEARNFFSESVSQQYLDPSYAIIGKTTGSTPKYLFQRLKKFPQWDEQLSDDY